MPIKYIAHITGGELRQSPMRWPVCIRRCSLSIAAILAMALNILPRILLAQASPYSSSVEYKSMLDELRQDNVRPSRLGTGTLLTAMQPPVPLNIDETGTTLRLEANAWRLEIAKDDCIIALPNKKTDLTWQLADRGGNSAGIILTQATDKSAGLRPTKIKRIEQRRSSWQIQVEVAGSTATVNHLWDKPDGAVNLWYDQETMDTLGAMPGCTFLYFLTFILMLTKLLRQGCRLLAIHCWNLQMIRRSTIATGSTC